MSPTSTSLSCDPDSSLQSSKFSRLDPCHTLDKLVERAELLLRTIAQGRLISVGTTRAFLPRKEAKCSPSRLLKMPLHHSPSPRCGGLVSETAAAWGPTSGNLLIASGRHLRIHALPAPSAGGAAAASPPPLPVLAGHDGGDVISVASVGRGSPGGPPRAISASADGTLRLWDTASGACERTVDVGEVLRSVAVAGGVAVAAGWRAVYAISIAGGRRNLVWKFGVRFVGCGGGGKVVVGAKGRDVFVVYRESGTRKEWTWTEVLDVSAVAVSEDGSMMAVGDVGGGIMIYRMKFEKGGRWNREAVFSLPSRLHWHATAVLALTFAAGGTVLLSGGAEAVLVSWKVGLSEFGDRSFRPRLGGAIWGISESPDRRYYAVTCADNAVRVLDSLNLTQRAAFRGLAVPPLPPSNAEHIQVRRKTVLRRVPKLSMVADPGHNGGVFIAGIGGSVQFYDVFRGEHVGFFPVVAQNQVFSSGVKGMQPHAPDVKHVCMAPDGESMATVDVLQQSADKQDVLRFWQRDERSDQLEMIGRLESPHGRGGFVTDLCFHPTLPVLATASCSGTVKLWRLVSTGYKPKPCTWRCENVLSYKEQKCTSLSFSADGSMLAVGAGSTVVLWHVYEVAADTVSDEEGGTDGTTLVDESSPCSLKADLLHAFVHPPSSEIVRNVAFLAGVVPTVVATTKNGVYVWNVLSQSIWWSLRLVMSSRRVTVDPCSQRFAVIIDALKVLPEDITTGFTDLTKLKKTKTHKRVGTDGKDLMEKKGELKSGRETGVADKVDPGKKSDGKHTVSRHLAGKSTWNQPNVDKVVVIFDFDNPVPVCVHRLPPDSRLLSAAFVPLPGKTASGPQPSPLVYMDGELEVHTIADQAATEFLDGIYDPFNLKPGVDDDLDTDADLPSTGDRNRLDALLTQNWRDDVVARKEKAAASAGIRSKHGNVAVSLAASFAGATHTQAPVAVSSVRAVAEMLKVSGAARERAIGEETTSAVGRGRRRSGKASSTGNLDTVSVVPVKPSRKAAAREPREVRKERISRLAAFFTESTTA